LVDATGEGTGHGHDQVLSMNGSRRIGADAGEPHLGNVPRAVDGYVHQRQVKFERDDGMARLVVGGQRKDVGAFRSHVLVT
jgi:hypothetical protein